MKSFSTICRYLVYVLTVIAWAQCSEPVAAAIPEDRDSTVDDQRPAANRRSIIGDYHGLYAPSYHNNYVPASYHGHYAPATYHSQYAPLAHYHGHYAPGHYHHGHSYYDHEVAVHGFKHHPVVYQSVVNTYPTATTVVHKPVPVPVAHPVPVPIARPVPVEVPRPYPVPVNRPYPVHIIKPVPVPVAQPYPVTVYRPYPVPVYRSVPVAVARPVVRIPVARIPLTRYPVQPSSSYIHSHAYAPHYHAYIPHHAHAYRSQHYLHRDVTAAFPPASYNLQQLAAVRATAGGEYDETAVTQQQALLQDNYSFLQHEQQDAAVATDVHHHDEVGHHHLHHDNAIDQDGGYPSLTTDDTFKTSLGVPNTDYTGKKKK